MDKLIEVVRHGLFLSKLLRKNCVHLVLLLNEVILQHLLRFRVEIEAEQLETVLSRSLLDQARAQRRIHSFKVQYLFLELANRHVEKPMVLKDLVFLFRNHFHKDGVGVGMAQLCKELECLYKKTLVYIKPWRQLQKLAIIIILIFNFGSTYQVVGTFVSFYFRQNLLRLVLI